MMLALFGYLFVMAEIATMHETKASGTWIPSKMIRDAEPIPKIASFANQHHLALLYAELLRKYVSNPSLLGLASNTLDRQRYEGESTSGYFCRHDNHISFVPETDQNKLPDLLVSYKKKYEQTDWTLPSVVSVSSAITTEQKSALQVVVDANKDGTDLLRSVCVKVEEYGFRIEFFNTKCPVIV